MDNFEWQHGIWPRMGLIGVDYHNNASRMIRPSAREYGRLIKERQVEI